MFRLGFSAEVQQCSRRHMNPAKSHVRAKSSSQMKTIVTWLVVVSLGIGFLSISNTKAVKFSEAPNWVRYQGKPVRLAADITFAIPKNDKSPTLEYQFPATEPKRILLSNDLWSETSSTLLITKDGPDPKLNTMAAHSSK